jgi:hypothetical protein
MTTEITQGTIQGLSDEALASAKGWISAEEGLRTEKRRQDAISKIKALAGANGFSVTINGKRGRPPKVRADAGSAKAAR